MSLTQENSLTEQHLPVEEQSPLFPLTYWARRLFSAGPWNFGTQSWVAGMCCWAAQESCLWAPPSSLLCFPLRTWNWAQQSLPSCNLCWWTLSSFGQPRWQYGSGGACRNGQNSDQMGLWPRPESQVSVNHVAPHWVQTSEEWSVRPWDSWVLLSSEVPLLSSLLHVSPIIRSHLLFLSSSLWIPKLHPQPQALHHSDSCRAASLTLGEVILPLLVDTAFQIHVNSIKARKLFPSTSTRPSDHKEWKSASTN